MQTSCSQSLPRRSAYTCVKRATSFNHTDTTVHSKVQGNSWVPVWNSKLAETKLQMHLVLDARLNILGDHALHFWSQSPAQWDNQAWNLLWLDSKFMVLPRRYTWDPLSKDLIVSNIIWSFNEMHYIPTNLISCDLCVYSHVRSCHNMHVDRVQPKDLRSQKTFEGISRWFKAVCPPEVLTLPCRWHTSCATAAWCSMADKTAAQNQMESLTYSDTISYYSNVFITVSKKYTKMNTCYMLMFVAFLSANCMPTCFPLRSSYNDNHQPAAICHPSDSTSMEHKSMFFSTKTLMNWAKSIL